MNSKEFFYLDGADKRGPYSKQEIIELKLVGETLIFSDELNKWIPYKKLESFKDKEDGINFENKRNKSKAILTKITVLLFLIISASGTAYYLTEEYKKKDFLALEKKANDVFSGKDEICDYTKAPVKGRLEKPEDDETKYFTYICEILNGGDEVYEYHNLQDGGWTVYTLKKLNNGYDLIKYYAMDMGFKVPESYYHAGIDVGYFTTSGYSIPSNRGSVQNAYNEAMLYISVENKNKSYVAGSYDKINTFKELYSDLHFIENIVPERHTSASKNLKSWKSNGAEAYSSVFNTDWIVWYAEYGDHYEIVINKQSYQKKLLINIGIALAFAILLYMIWLYSLKNKLYKN